MAMIISFFVRALRQGLTAIYMIVFVLHGSYTDRAYAYTTLKPKNYSGTVTT
jgi:hypothetical protein